MTRQLRQFIALLLGLVLLLGACGGGESAPAGSNAWNSAVWDLAIWQ